MEAFDSQHNRYMRQCDEQDQQNDLMHETADRVSICKLCNEAWIFSDTKHVGDPDLFEDSEFISSFSDECSKFICPPCVESQKEEMFEQRIKEVQNLMEKAGDILKVIEEVNEKIRVQDDYITGKYSNFGYQREYLKRKEITTASKKRLQNQYLQIIQKISNGNSRN